MGGKRGPFVALLVLLVAMSGQPVAAGGETQRGESPAESRSLPDPPALTKPPSGVLLGGAGPGVEITAVLETPAGTIPEVALTARGIERSNAGGRVSEFRGTLESFTRLVEDGIVTAATRAYPPVEQTVSEGVAVVGADGWQTDGVDGTGVKVAIVDAGFTGYADLLGSDLPASVTTQSFHASGISGTSEHGTAVAEIVHDVAPGATLYLVNLDSSLDMPDVVDYLIAQGIDVVNMSLGWLAGPYDGTTDVAVEVQRASDAGILWVNSAGNHRQDHWGGTFSDADADGWHAYASSEEINAFETVAGDVMTAYLSWSESTSDFDLCIFDLEYATPELVGCSSDTQGSGERTVEAYSWVSLGGTYGAAVAHFSGPKGRFDLFVPTYWGLDRVVEATSLPVPAEVVDVVTVGATPVSNPVFSQDYSGVGPTVVGDLKPDLVAPDEVSGTTYGAAGFAGTSASSPHVAGMAALLLDDDATLTVAELMTLLQDTADPFAGGSTSTYWGHGLAQMPPPPSTEPPPGPPEVVSVSVDPDSVDTATGAAVTVDVAFTAESEGLEKIHIIFASPSGPEVSVKLYSHIHLISGTTTDGVVSGDITIPQWAETGTWAVDRVITYDNADRVATYQRADLDAASVPIEDVTVTGDADTDPPVVTSFTLSPDSIDNGTTNTVTIDIGFTDDVSGISTATLYLESESGEQRGPIRFYDTDLLSGSLQDGVLRTTMEMHQWAEPGTWQLQRLYVRDASGRNITRYRADLVSAGVPLDTITVTGELDEEPPAVTSVSFTPSTVDNAAPSDVTVQIGVTDDVSGVYHVRIYLLSPSGAEERQFYLYEAQLGSGTPQDGVFEHTFTMDQWAEPGVWVIDEVQVQDDVRTWTKYYSEAELLAAGATITPLTVTGGHDVDPPRVSAVDLTPADADNTGSTVVTIDLTLTDDVSGFTNGWVELVGPGGFQTESATFDVDDLQSGDATSGVFRASVTIDPGAERGMWTVGEVALEDAVEHSAGYDTEYLILHDIPFGGVWVHDGSGLPTSAQNPFATTKGTGSVLVTWDAPIFSGSSAVSYLIETRIAAHSTVQPQSLDGPIPQIVGGDVVSISDYPWQGAMLVADEPRADYGQFCGASLIGPRWAVTAAHCVEGVDPELIDLAFGQTVLSEITAFDRVGVSRIFIHPDFDTYALTSDIALLELEGVPRGAQVIGVPFDPSQPTSSNGGWATGWGNFYSADPEYADYLPDPLLGVFLGVRSSPNEAECEQWGPVYNKLHHLCAGNTIYFKGTCVGDSGGPFAIVEDDRYMLYGVTSFGAAPEAGDCGHPYRPSVFSRVTSYAAWIAGYVGMVEWVEYGTVSGTSLRLDGLAPGFEYEVRVTAFNDAGSADPVVAVGLTGGDRRHDVGTTEGVKDPGFESGSVGASKHKFLDEGGAWSIGSAGAMVGGSGAVYDSTGQSGLAVLMVNGSRGDGSRHIQVSAGDVVGFSAWVNTGPGATNRIRPRIHFFDADGKYLSGVTSGPTRPKGSWTWLDVAGVAPEGAAFAMFQIRIHNDGGVGEYYVDQVRVHGPIGPLDGAVKDPGFESGSVGASKHKFLDEGGSWSIGAAGALVGSYGAVYDSTGQSGLAVLMVNGSRGDGSKHVAVAPGDVVGYSAWVNTGPGAANRMRPRIHFFDADGKYVSGVTNGVTRPKGTWTWMNVAGVAPEGAAFAMFQIRIHNDGNDGEYYIDALEP